MSRTVCSPAVRLLWALGISILAIPLTGCQTGSSAPYVAPRVTGRVLDARTSEPLADVKVRRLTSDQDFEPDTPPHGGEAIKQPSPVRTGPDGTFVLDSVRDLTPFRRSGWYGVRISFERPGYLRRIMLYTLANSTNTAKGEPLVLAGDVRLESLPH